MNALATVNVRILSLGTAERYAVRRLVTAAQHELQTQFPRLEVSIVEIGDPSEIGQFARVLILPTLVVNEKVVCSGRYPSREDVVAWLREALS